MERMGVRGSGLSDLGGSEASGGGVAVQVLATSSGVKFQNPPGLALPGKRNQGVGQAWGREVQEARDTRHLCDLGLCVSTF